MAVLSNSSAVLPFFVIRAAFRFDEVGDVFVDLRSLVTQKSPTYIIF